MEEQTIQLQEILINLTEENFETTLEFLLNSIFIKVKSNLFLLVHNFFIIANCRPKNMLILSRLLFSLYSSPSNKTNALKFLPQAILDESRNNLYPPYYFFYCLMKSGFPTNLIINSLVDQFDGSLRKSLINQNLKIFREDQIFYGYALFAPELIEANKFDWFNYVIEFFNDSEYQMKNKSQDNELKMHLDGDYRLTKNVKLFIKRLPKLSENNFAKYKELRDIGWNSDERYIAIQKDDDSKLEQLCQQSEADIKKFVNKPIKWCLFERCNFLNNNPRPIHVAAFFNSTKCLSFLISHGADLNATDLSGRTVVQFSIAGGYFDLRLFDRNKCTFDGSLHIAAKFHQYQLFELIRASFQTSNKLINIAKKSSNSGQTTGDTSDIEGELIQPQKRGKKTEIKTRSGNNISKISFKQETTTAITKQKGISKSKLSSFVAGLSNAITINGPQAFLTNNIQGLGTILHQAALSNCLKILTLFLNVSGRSEVIENLNDFVNCNASQEKSSKNKICYYSYIKNDTPLIVAIKSYNIEAFNFLLSLPSVDINAQNLTLLKTALHVAAKRGYEYFVRKLLDQPQIDLNSPDFEGRTPAFEATYYLQYEILKILSENESVDFDFRDKSGKRPYEIKLVVPVGTVNGIHYGDLIRLLRKFSH